MATMSWIDTTIVICYVCCIFLVGVYAWWDNYRAKKNNTTNKADSYFLASRNVLWLSVAATLFSSNIGAEHFVGLAGTAASTGITVGAFEWTAPWMLWIMAYFLSDLYILSGVVTTPEYLELRFNRKVRIYNALMTLFIYVFVVISTTLYAGSVILETVVGWNLWTSSLTLIIATGIYVTLGGLKAVVWTDNVQTCILLLGGTILAAVSLYRVNGIGGLREFYENYPDDSKRDNMHMFRPWDDEDWPWPGICFGIFCNSYYYWNGQHLLIQRILAAKSPLHAKNGAILTSLLKILPVFIMVIPGMCAIKLFPEEFENDTSQEYDRAYPLMVINILPTGLVGIVVASMLSALMSSLAAVYNSASTIIVNDIYKLYDPNISDSKSVKLGRIGACLFVIFSVLWLPSIQNNESELFIYTQQVIAYVNGPLSVVYFFGHFWDRANVYGAYVALGLGFILGIPRFVFGIILDNKYCENIFCESNYLYFALFLGIVCSIGLVIGSLLTAKPDLAQVDGLTYGSIQKKKKRMKEYVKDGMEEVDCNGNEIENGNGNGSEIGMVKTSVDVAIPEKNGNGDNESHKDVISPLMEVTEQQKNESKYLRQFWKWLRLEGDEKNRKWVKMANILFLISFVTNIAMWVWFR